MFALLTFSLLALDPWELPIFELFVGLIAGISNGITDFGGSSCFVRFVSLLSPDDPVTDVDAFSLEGAWCLFSFFAECSDSAVLFVEFSLVAFSVLFESALTFWPLLFSSYLFVAFSILSCVVASLWSFSSFFVVASSVDGSGFGSILCLFLSACSFSRLSTESVAGGNGLYGGIGRLFPPNSLK